VARDNWAIRDFGAGLVNRIDDNLLPDNAAKDCENVISQTIGSLKSRPGQARIHPSPLSGKINGLHAYYREPGGIGGALRNLVVATGAEVGVLNIGVGFTLINGGLNSAPTFFETGVNYMVVFNGVNAPWKWNGQVVSPLLNAPNGRIIILHKERLFTVTSENPSMLRWCNPFMIESWPQVNFWNVNDGDGDEITALVRFLGELIVFKRRSMHSLRGSSMTDFRMDELVSRVGAVGPRAVTQHGMHLYFISDEGLHVFNGMKEDNLSRMKIPRFWNNINTTHLHKACVVSWDGLIFFALPKGTSTENNIVIAYDPMASEGGSFWPWSGINSSCFEVYDDGTRFNLFSGDSVQNFVNQQFVGQSDFGQDISGFWEGKYYDLGVPEHEKKAKRIFLQRSPFSQGAPVLTVSVDYESPQVLVFDRSDNMVDQYRFPTRERWRYLSPRVSYSGIKGFEVRGILLPFKAKRRPKVRGGSS